MARPVIIYNASSGSDTAASGAGPATALTGSNNAYSGDGAGGGTQTVITLGGTPDLSGVATDGSHALWLNNTSGERHLFRITAVNDGADTVTVSTAPTTSIDTGSEVSWAIGGKRQTLENDSTRPDWDDIETGWAQELEAGTYTITSSIQYANSQGNHIDGSVDLRSSEPGTVVPVIDRTGSFDSYIGSGGGNCIVNGIKFTRSSGSSTSAHALDLTSMDYCYIVNCEIDGTGMGDGITCSTGGPSHLIIENTEVYSCVVGIDYGNNDDVAILRCSVHDNSDAGIRNTFTSNIGTMLIQSNLIYDNGASGIDFTGIAGTFLLIKNTIYGNTSDGFEISDSTGTDSTMIVLEENSMTANGGYGANVASDQLLLFASNKNNHYHGNTSGARNNLSAGENDTSGDPLFTSVTDGSENFTPTSGSPLLDAGITLKTA